MNFFFPSSSQPSTPVAAVAASSVPVPSPSSNNNNETPTFSQASLAAIALRQQIYHEAEVQNENDRLATQDGVQRNSTTAENLASLAFKANKELLDDHRASCKKNYDEAEQKLQWELSSPRFNLEESMAFSMDVPKTPSSNRASAMKQAPSVHKSTPSSKKAARKLVDKNECTVQFCDTTGKLLETQFKIPHPEEFYQLGTIFSDNEGVEFKVVECEFKDCVVEGKTEVVFVVTFEPAGAIGDEEPVNGNDEDLISITSSTSDDCTSDDGLQDSRTPQKRAAAPATDTDNKRRREEQAKKRKKAKEIVEQQNNNNNSRRVTRSRAKRL